MTMENQGSPLVLLPGAYMHAEDFATHGFVATARRHFSGDIVPLETGMQAYLDGSLVGRLHEVISPLRARVWLAGVSLGGLGALLYAQAHPEAVEGLLLMAPFIGTRGAVHEVIEAGGFEAWQPPADDQATDEQRLLQWLKSCRQDIYLAYGVDDRFAASYRLLASLLPAGRVVTGPGGHDWETWKSLWERLLHSAQLCAG